MRLLVILLLFTGSAVAQHSSDERLPTPAWVPFPADHWPQEPDGYNGMKFDATRAETEKTTTLENCQVVIYGNLSCKTTLDVAGKLFKADILFGVTPGSPVSEGRLTNIYAAFHKTDFAHVKAAFVKMYGRPHRTGPQPNGESGEFLTWTGNRAEISLHVLRDDAAFVIMPNLIARGARFGASLETIPASRKQ